MDTESLVAYALNMCTVSVSQIVDYNDEYILEQEYDNILNNINLQVIPKDSSLRSILMEILNTITFFRIQKLEKEKIDKRYQQRVQNAIWSAVPSFGSFFCGHSVGAVISLALQVGSGYMNYRKEKASILLNREEDELSLRITLIEQLNALRRELFSTAWDLSKDHDFQDSFRLSERQIRQYNEILCDTDVVRKYDRLLTFEKKLHPADEEENQNISIPYPPLYYYLGNAANEIAEKNPRKYDGTKLNEFRKAAKTNYDKVIAFDQKNLLREDAIMAACALEYAELLLKEFKDNLGKNENGIFEKLEIAEKHAGTAMDILQLCAVEYLNLARCSESAKEEANKHAVEILKRLVNEGYNRETNGQLLNGLYLSSYLSRQSNYDVTRNAVNDLEFLMSSKGKYLVKPPENLEDSETDFEKRIQSDFLDQQRNLLKRKYTLVLKEFFTNYTVKYNKIIPTADGTEFKDSYYLDNTSSAYRRRSSIHRVLKTTNKREDYLRQLRDTVFSQKVVALLNEMYGSILTLEMIDSTAREELHSALERAVRAQSTKMVELQEKLEPKNIAAFSQNDFDQLFEISFVKFVGGGKIIGSFRNILNSILRGKINHMEKTVDFSCASAALDNLCERENIKNADYLLEDESPYIEEEMPLYFNYDKLFGEKMQKVAREADIRGKVEECIQNSISNDLVVDDKHAKIVMRSNGNEFQKLYETQAIKGIIDEKDCDVVAILKLQPLSIPVIEPVTTHLVMTVDGIIVITPELLKKSKPHPLVKYGSESICWVSGNKIAIGETEISSNAINMGKFEELLQHLSCFS